MDFCKKSVEHNGPTKTKPSGLLKRSFGMQWRRPSVFLTMSLPEMKVNSPSTTPTLNARTTDGTLQNRLDKKKLTCLSPQVQTVNCVFYVEVMKYWSYGSTERDQKLAPIWKFHHDNAVFHNFVVTKYLVKNGIVMIPQPPYSPDLASADFFLFSVFKTT